MPYVRAALVAAWQHDGHTVFLPDSARTGVRIAYAVEEAGIRYEKRRRNNSPARRASYCATILRMRTAACWPTSGAPDAIDLIARTQRIAMESEAWPETQGTPPRKSTVRRLLEPAVLTTAMAITTWLFFSLRSDGEDSP